MSARFTSAMMAALFISLSANANDLRINGFMNVTAGHLSTEDISQDGYDDGVKFDQDTLVGVQLAQQVNDSTSATAQLISRGREDFNTEAAWVYVTYAVNDDTDIRLGRLRTPYFHYSDFLEVGYAYNWVRPPSLVYRLDAFSSINGIDISHRFAFGQTDGVIQIYSGRYKDDLGVSDSAYTIELRRAFGIVASFTQGNFGGRASDHQADVSLDIDPTQAGAGGRVLDNLAAQAALLGVGDEFLADDAKAKFYQASINYDNGSTSLIAEWTALDQDTASLLDDSAYLISAAQRLGEATLHLTYTQAEDDPESGTVGPLQSMAEYKQSSIIVGVRYDYDSSAAFKVDVQYNDEELVNGQDGDSGILYNLGMSLVF